MAFWAGKVVCRVLLFRRVCLWAALCCGWIRVRSLDKPTFLLSRGVRRVSWVVCQGLIFAYWSFPREVWHSFMRIPAFDKGILKSALLLVSSSSLVSVVGPGSLILSKSFGFGNFTVRRFLDGSSLYVSSLLSYQTLATCYGGVPCRYVALSLLVYYVHTHTCHSALPVHLTGVPLQISFFEGFVAVVAVIGRHGSGVIGRGLALYNRVYA